MEIEIENENQKLDVSTMWCRRTRIQVSTMSQSNSRFKKKYPTPGQGAGSKTVIIKASDSRRRPSISTPQRNGQASALNGHATSKAAPFLTRLFGGRTKGNIFVCSYANDRGDAGKFP